MIKERLSAHYVCHNQKLIKRGIVVLDENHRILELIDNGGKAVELPYMRFLNGVLLPLKDDTTETFLSLKSSLTKAMDQSRKISLDAWIMGDGATHLVKLEEGKSFSFALLKNVDYSGNYVCAPLSLSKVKNLF